MPDPIWIREDTVRAIHRRQIQEHGGADGIRDPGLLANRKKKSGLARLAAALAFGIVWNHPFVDGNKRTALVVCRTFLLLNGRDLRASRAEKYFTIIKLAEGTLTEEELAAWIRERLEAAAP